MKRIIYKLSLVLIMFGCSEILDIKPTNIISDEDVRNDPVLVDAFLNKIYSSTRFRSGSTYSPDQALLNVMAAETNVFAGWQAPYNAAMRIIDESGAHPQAEYWPYGNIRSANEIIEILEGATFDPDLVQQKIAEARWLRAFMYFELVKRYGGVPLITVPQSIDQPIEELYVARNSEKEIYDFVASEIDDIVALLPDSYPSSEFGKPTKWAAYALKSRAMLYAGSIAKYGTEQLNGILGIPSGEANAYYQKAYDASMEVINGNFHPLYEENPNPADNYAEIFVKDGNSEVIFAEVYSLALLKTHSWNNVSMPQGFNAGWGSNNPVYMESVGHFEHLDGRTGAIDFSKLDGTTLIDMDTFLLDRDPRFEGSVFHPKSLWQDGEVYFHTKTIGTIPPGSTWPSASPPRNRKKTGLLIRKRVDESIILPTGGTDETDWILFRTGEMYINAAEAAFEMGDEPTARGLINTIRQRAGMPDKTLLTLEDVRNERFVELFIEEHRYWDMRRWRIAVDVLDQYEFSGVIWNYDIDQDLWTAKRKSGEYGNVRSFVDRNYYFPIGLNRIADNPNLVENPGY